VNVVIDCTPFFFFFFYPMMNLQWIAALASTLVILGVSAENDIDWYGMCDHMDWKVINDALLANTDTDQVVPTIDGTNTNHRYLRTKAERDLQSYCKQACRGFAPGTCRVDGCKGYIPNTVATPSSGSSSSTIKTPVPPPSGKQRQLDDNDKRELQQSYCKQACAGYAPGSCLARGCLGYNPKNVATPSSSNSSAVKTPVPPQRQLHDVMTLDGIAHAQTLERASTIEMITKPCADGQTKDVHHQLDYLIQTNAVSSKCQDLLNELRHTTCY
jgi:hypothetical protein